jgi:hypothetical protein
MDIHCPELPSRRPMEHPARSHRLDVPDTSLPEVEDCVIAALRDLAPGANRSRPTSTSCSAPHYPRISRGVRSRHAVAP